MVIVDTTVWVDYFRGTTNPETEWLDAHLGRRQAALNDLILCEILQGMDSEPAAERVRKDLLNLVVFDTGGVELAVAAARNYRSLRRRAVTIRRTVDCLIATHCLLRGHSLLHRDRDFDPFEQFLGLRVVRPAGGF